MDTDTHRDMDITDTQIGWGRENAYAFWVAMQCDLPTQRPHSKHPSIITHMFNPNIDVVNK